MNKKAGILIQLEAGVRDVGDVLEGDQAPD